MNWKTPVEGMMETVVGLAIDIFVISEPDSVTHCKEPTHQHIHVVDDADKKRRKKGTEKPLVCDVWQRNQWSELSAALNLINIFWTLWQMLLLLLISALQCSHSDF